MVLPAFRRGAEEAAKASKGASFARTQYLSLPKDGDFCYVRFLHEVPSIITVDQHQSVPTKPGPQDAENWPSTMGAVCRRDPALAGMFPDCFICDHGLERDFKGKPKKKPSARTWMLACLREPIYEEGPDGKPTNKLIGFKDARRTIAVTGPDGKPTGEEKSERAIVVINLGHKNFTGQVIGFSGMYGHTLLDRDYFIKREGEEKDTVYRVGPMDPFEVPDPEDKEAAKAEGREPRYIRYDLRNPEFLKRYGFDSEADVYQHLGEIVVDRASDAFYGRFFDTRVTVSDDGEVKAESNPQAPPAPSGDVDDEALNALQARVKGYAAPASTPPPAPAPTNGSEPKASEPPKVKAPAKAAARSKSPLDDDD